MFKAITSFTPENEEKYNKKIGNLLKPHYGYLIASIKSIDPTNTGLLTFLQFRKLLDNFNINLNDNDIEYLIYKLKKMENEDNNLEMLKYQVNIYLLFKGTT